ncbi:hypothetical protein NDU88_007622 [Pleurodeles waltl]|uniref:Reverse transcriptase domain-containing protein n=1 Tax=Pleurodeles waltl TaxID=8319 RepID=A0AAV7PPI2_PLEWA|nr:hypothetical protein NDU88_007622 [Pleurodeles waltl]
MPGVRVCYFTGCSPRTVLPSLPAKTLHFNQRQRYLRHGRLPKRKEAPKDPLIASAQKGVELRPCIDYTAINRIIVKNCYPLLLISVLLDQVKGAQMYTKLDFRAAYHLIRIREGD